jgi:pyridoxamine 5'-phosphate oxidase-like protein
MVGHAQGAVLPGGRAQQLQAKVHGRRLPARRAFTLPAVRWDEFAAAVPELAALGEERLRERELCLVGTIRRNGWPRISPVEPEFVDGELMLGMMWRSPKALDLLRDPRLVVHSVVSTRLGNEGDFKLYGRAMTVEEGVRRTRYRATVRARIGWAPEEPNYHVFAVDVDSAGFVTFAEGNRYGLAWNPDGGLRRWEQRES